MITLVNDGHAAEARGFTSFNTAYPHLLVDVPDGGFTITTKTSQGKKVTFHFGVYKKDGPPQFIDVQNHTNGTHWNNNGNEVATTDLIVFAGGRDAFDSRRNIPEGQPKPGLICILIEDPKEAG